MNARAKQQKSLADEILDGVWSGEGQITSLKEAYVEITGDREMSGRLRDCNDLRMHQYLGSDETRFTEAITTSTFANTLANSVNRVMLQHYTDMAYLDGWRKVARVVRAEDFRPIHGMLIGGYPALPVVGEGSPYLDLGGLAEEAYSFAVSKRGGTESITMETIRNDDVGLVRQIAVELALAAKHTLFETVFDFLVNNAVVGDGLTLFHATHGNTGAQALSAASISGAFRAMRKQQNAVMNKRNFISPKLVLVPNELEETAYNALQRDLNQDRNFIQSQGLEVVPVGYWSDATKWFMAGDPAKHPTIDVAFLDGKEDPELIVADDPVAGSLFSNDAITLKIRHAYGAQVADFRSFYHSKP